MPSRAPHDGVGEDDEAAPGDRRIPRPERLGVRERGRLGDDHDREAKATPYVSLVMDHVTRTLNEHPSSAGVPTPLPRMSTLCVLPSPPGTMSVLNCGLRRADCGSARTGSRPI